MPSALVHPYLTVPRHVYHQSPINSSRVQHAPREDLCASHMTRSQLFTARAQLLRAPGRDAGHGRHVSSVPIFRKPVHL